MFWKSLRTLLDENESACARLDALREGFVDTMSRELDAMWAKKLGLIEYDEPMLMELLQAIKSEAWSKPYFQAASLKSVWALTLPQFLLYVMGLPLAALVLQFLGFSGFCYNLINQRFALFGMGQD